MRRIIELSTRTSKSLSLINKRKLLLQVREKNSAELVIGINRLQFKAELGIYLESVRTLHQGDYLRIQVKLENIIKLAVF